MSERTWTTKEGKEIPVGKLETLHLANCIKMLNRIAFAVKRALLAEAYGALYSLRGEQARLSLEIAIKAMESLPAHDYLSEETRKKHKELTREAERRGLTIDAP